MALDTNCRISNNILDEGKRATETDPVVLDRTVQETYKNTLPKNHAYIDAEVEAIHMILSGNRDEICSTFDACKTTQEIWTTIERLHQGESLNKQDVKTNLFWEFGKFFSRYGESIESYYSRFYKMMNEMIGMTTNHLALVAAAQQYPNDNHYHAPKPYKNQTTSFIPTSSTSSHTATRIKGKEVAKPITPLSSSKSKEANIPKQAQRDKDMQKNLELISMKPKQVKDYSCHKEKMMMCKQEEKGVPLSAKQSDSLQDTNEEPNEQEVEAHYMYMTKIHEVLQVIDDNSGPTYDTKPLEQNADNNDEDECVELANLIENLKYDIDKNKKIQKQLKKANTILTHEFNESRSALTESNMNRDRCKIALHQKEVKDNKENDKIRAKSDKIKSKREAWKSLESSPTK
uniref:Gag-Pol polyprotein n=1 Tax=Tanacetum cinerariifolium TaxID=118510 RepID=A0A699GIQ6_TANCI|nr:hypothetical protein [Tanacetum cinerariifolium]